MRVMTTHICVFNINFIGNSNYYLFLQVGIYDIIIRPLIENNYI